MKSKPSSSALFACLIFALGMGTTHSTEAVHAAGDSDRFGSVRKGRTQSSDDEVLLEAAVAEFNGANAALAGSVGESPLTATEVLASVLLCVPEQYDLDEKSYAALVKQLRVGKLPKGARLKLNTDISIGSSAIPESENWTAKVFNIWLVLDLALKPGGDMNPDNVRRVPIRMRSISATRLK